MKFESSPKDIRVLLLDVRGVLEGSQGIGCYSDCSVGLNDQGAITGYYLDSNNVNHGFLLLPSDRD